MIVLLLEDRVASFLIIIRKMSTNCEQIAEIPNNQILTEFLE